MKRLLFAAFAGLSMLLASAAPGLAEPSAAAQAQLKQMAEEDAAAERAYEADRVRDQELRRQHADEIRAHDKAINDWRANHPAPEGSTYSSIHTSYDDDFLPEGTDVTYFNRWNVPTHTVDFGPDGAPEGPVTQTQQGKAWETYGPTIPPGGGFAPSFGEDFDGNEIITRVEVFDDEGRVVARYDFNFDGIAWRGERFDPDTGRRTGAFQDDRLRPPEDTLGGPLPVPDQVRFLTGVCDKCRPLMEKQNELAREIDGRIIEMQSLSEQHQNAYAAQQRPIRARYEYLKGELAVLMPQFEAAQAEAIACDKGCRPSEENNNFAVNDPSGEPLPTPPAGPGGPQPEAGVITPTADAYPASNADLEQAMAAVQAYLAAANCDGMECPVCDCAQAREAVQALSDLEHYLTAMLPYLQAAQADHMKLLQSQIETSALNADQQARTIEAIALHQALHNFGSMLLDIASVMSWAKEIATSEKALDELSPAEFLDRLDGLYEAMKDLESGINTAAEAESGQEQDSPIADLVELAPGVDKDFINDTTSTISDVKSIVQAAVENGKDWRKALKEGGALAALGQIGGRYLKGFSADKLKERQRALADLERDAGAVGVAQTSAYNEWRKAGDRRWMAEDLLAAVREAQTAYGGCVYRVCGAFTMTRPVIPSFLQEPPGGGEPQLSWGKALRWFNGAIAQTLPRLKPVPFTDDCPPKDEPKTQPDEPAPANAIGSAPLPPEAARPPLTPVTDPAVPASFCSETDRVAFLNTIYNPAAAAALANSQTTQAHVGKLNSLFTEYMRNEGGPVWAAIQREMAAYKTVADDAFAQSNRINGLYSDILAVPIVECPKLAENGADNAIPSTGEPVTPVKDAPKPETPQKPCPPKERREPIVVGPNSKVGSGARFKAKAASTALGIAGGLLGGGGGGSPFGGGGGGGSSGPRTVVCKIKDSEMTVFNDPLTGVMLKVGAKRAGDTVVVFADIAKSPDNGTFQTAFMENPQGDTLAPADIGICDLWGEWKLTVSWTKSTYVDGQLVKQESGGWSKSGLFRIPGVLSSAEQPDGIWKRLGFSNASHGARKIAMQYRLPKSETAKGPVNVIIHITRPDGDPVTTVPFAMQMTEGPNGFTLTEAPKEECPPALVPVSNTTATTAETPPGGTQTRPPAAKEAPPEGPVRNPSDLGPTRTGDGPQPVDNLYLLEQLIDARRKLDMDKIETLTNWPCPVNEDTWRASRHDWIDNLEDWRAELNRMTPTGLVADGVREAIEGEKARVNGLLSEWPSRGPPNCPGPEEPGTSIMDEVEPTLVPS